MKEYKYKINGKDYNVTVGDIEGNIAKVDVNGRNYTVEMEINRDDLIKSKPPVRRTTQPVATKKPVNSGGSVLAPLPGVINDIKVKVGDTIKKGDCVVILEAMKMENVINSDISGKVTAILVNKGDSVLENAPLIDIN
ncbi:MAG TPA: biotin/lipoyl-containing protein [Bacteroidaceae bacterium]|nr:biotin/lipoyl-containing protein [Bacteroidaceae bacterium]